MDGKININTDEVLRKFEKMEYSNLTDTFRSAISKSLQILKRRTISELRATGYNVGSPFRKGKTNYPSLVQGVIDEVSADGTEGRVRIAKAKGKGYFSPVGDDNFGLKWFEQGTKERHKKGKGYSWVANSNTRQGGARRKRNEGARTGKIESKEFFKKAYDATHEQMNDTLEREVSKALERIMNGQ